MGQAHLLGPTGPLRALVEADRLSSVILWGPPGSGKTTMARLVARASSSEMIELSAVTATVKDVREVIAEAARRLGEQGRERSIREFSHRQMAEKTVRLYEEICS